MVSINKQFIAGTFHVHDANNAHGHCTCSWHKLECYFCVLKPQYLLNINILGNADVLGLGLQLV